MAVNKASTLLILVSCFCCLTFSACTVSNKDVFKQRTLTSAQDVPPIAPSGASKLKEGESSQGNDADLQGKSSVKPPFQTAKEPLKVETIDGLSKKENQSSGLSAPPPPLISTPLTKDNEQIKSGSVYNSFPADTRDGRSQREEETERDVMEEALVLLDESHKYWVNGEMEDALEMLDQAYALLLDANGNPDIARQKDDLRLMISKRIMAIYNSLQSVSKGQRGEIPIISNPDVEKEIRQFQTVERDFFISSYQRSMLFRPIITRELKKAGLPEELSWLPLVESGFKINALSPARALGLWQFIPSTGYKYGLNRDEWIDERMDVEKSTRAAIDYLKDLHSMFGDWLTVLAGYNCGEGRVGRTIASQHINYLDRFWDLYQRLPYETARYVPRFLATLLIVKEPKKYGFDLVPFESKMDLSAYETADINRSMRLQDIAQKMEMTEEHLNILNAELRHRMTPDRPYKLKVPREKAEALLAMVAEIPSGEKPRLSPQAVRGVFIKHKVRQGETLDSIAVKYKTTAGAIRTANKLSKQRLVPGQRLNVPIRIAKINDSSDKEAKAGKVVRHKVQKGDTLASLARKYDMSAKDIRKINNMKNDTLKIGQTIRIEQENGESQTEERAKGETAEKKLRTGKNPAGQKTDAAAKKYTVKKGDSLNLIARENGMTLDQLLNLNHMTKTDLIVPGQVILVE